METKADWLAGGVSQGLQTAAGDVADQPNLSKKLVK